ncbi:MAG TPA: aldose 1-epimerase [Caulobacteraceae bacterium]|nr:aldose 1-epimerase [Caulobacteraceae bacterium]
MSLEPPERLALEAGDLQLDLLPHLGGAVAGYRWRRPQGTVALFRETPADAVDVLQTGCFPLAPYCNRIRDGRFTFRGREVRLSPNLPPQKHPLHGQAWRHPWEVEDAGGAWAELVYRHSAGEWPWDYEARQRFSLDEGGLEIRIACRNLADEPMPCGLGLHPFFDAPDDTVLDTRVSGVWTIDDEIMPVVLEPATGRYALENRRIARADLDNGYEGWSGEAIIRWPGAGAGVRITSDDAPRFQVYAPADKPVLCAEPVTNANDALGRPEEAWAAAGVVILPPGEETAMSARFDPVASP